MSTNQNVNELLMQKTIEELLQSGFVKNTKGNTMIAFNGVMSQETIVGMGEVLRSELHQYHPLNIVNKIFAIYIEMTQNVLHYSYLRSDSNGKSIGLGSVLVLAFPNGYRLVTANLVNEQQKENLTSKCQLINSLNEVEIKDHYLNRRRKMAEGDSKGAGLGFFDMVRRSGRPVEFIFEPIDNEQYYFYLGANIIIG